MSHEQELNALRASLPATPETIDEGPKGKQAPVLYSVEVAKRIIDDYSQGVSLHAISRKPGMPSYQTLLRWNREHAELSKMLRSVRETRALHFENAAIEAAESASGKDADRLKVDTYIWAAGVNDPTTYGKKVTHQGDAQNPVT